MAELPRIKVCGLTRPEDVRTALEAGADALGFVQYAPSPRDLSNESAAALIADVPPEVARVLVVVDSTPEAAREALSKAPGLDVIDDVENNEYPLPLKQSNVDNCAVGRIRKDCAMDNGLCFWVAGDQLLKGAALNAVQIAEELLKP